MKFCNNICTRFLSQIKKNSGPQGGTWQYIHKIDMDPRVYNFRVIYSTRGGNDTSNVNVRDNYRQCSTCEIMYNKSSYGAKIEYCLCCSCQLTLRHAKGGRYKK